MKYCAFLRGVNVNGTSMKMAEVMNVFTDAGMKEVSSVLASGNILFSSDKKPSELKNILEKSMSEYFDYEAFLFLKNENEISEIVNNNPFNKAEDLHIYVFVGIDDVETLLMEEFSKSDKAENENAQIVADTFYWQIQKGNTLGSTFGKVLGKKKLKDKITSRNINTFERILKKL
ncbi:DUF1697 domain-containing protein [Chryseobacterium sp. VAUSW3]|uniref:DUF1697 domain-containing protein n=1 Tax=Chryseobacterium sp. VAUSW3 TaxID=2010998 RepID=UPI000B4D1083|nr:DUF1697 domain-containing protein [Chryseobacterium sp. VAUSW3]OWR14174.1 hypothetical protein CDW55_07535 [Chryseobacterium sp. VAUSW3]